jgi:tRNA-intron endonuclease
MPGLLKEESVLVHDQREASQIYNKGYFGYPVSGGGLELDLIEALYLLESGRLEVVADDRPLTFPELTTIVAKAMDDFEVRYIVYRDIRQRGFVVKADYSDFDYRVYPRGGTPSNSQTKYWISAISERAAFDFEYYFKQVEATERTRKELLFGVVDEEGDLTYYSVNRARPKGQLPPPADGTVEGTLLHDRVFVFDEAQAALVKEIGHYGKDMGKVMQLSLIESCYLMDKGILTMRNVSTGKKLTLNGVMARGKKMQYEFELRLKAYSDLRDKGMVVKTGFKYGSHFRVYEGDPAKDHARYLVHAVPWDYRTMWPEMSRAVRLAHGVKKEILFARVSDERIEYMRLRRVRP